LNGGVAGTGWDIDGAAASPELMNTAVSATRGRSCRITAALPW
jgi:hypothetical protein